MVATARPDVIFYAYTKALNFWIERLGKIPSNLKLVASYGGKFDNLIGLYNLRAVTVVFSVADAQAKGLPLDDDDTYAWKREGNFALLLHGTQPPNTPASQAWQHIKNTVGGYEARYFAHYDKQKAANAWNRWNHNRAVDCGSSVLG